MSTTKMMSNHNRRFVTPIGVGPPIKRTIDGPKPPPFKRPNRPINPNPNSSPIDHNNNNKSPAQNNQLLAGYLAHEFLTKGTLFGEEWDPARAEAVPVSADSRRDSGPGRVGPGPNKTKKESYVAVSGLLKTDKVKLSGVVNPTQLGKFLQM